MNLRTLTGIGIGVSFVALVVYFAMGQFDARCEVCVSYRGRQVCETSRAAETSQATGQAMSSACARLTNGVSEVMECQRIRPTSVRCTE